MQGRGQQDAAHPQLPQALELLRAALTIDKDRTARTSIDGALTMRDVGGQQVSVVVADPVEIDDRVALWREPEFTSAGVNAVDPATTDVAVTNGVGRLLAAETASDLLREKGWNAHPAGNADSFAYTSTEVRYTPGERDAARDIFEKLLPYAMALGVATRWARKFEGIYDDAPPRWYVGPRHGMHRFSTVAFHASLNDAMTDAGTSMAARPRSIPRACSTSSTPAKGCSAGPAPRSKRSSRGPEMRPR